MLLYNFTPDSTLIVKFRSWSYKKEVQSSYSFFHMTSDNDNNGSPLVASWRSCVSRAHWYWCFALETVHLVSKRVTGHG